MITVIDSGVWISALHFGGTPRLTVEQAFAVDEVAICDQIVSEITRILINKMGWDRHRVHQSMQVYFEDVISMRVSGDLRGVCRDPKDDMVLECALAARAQAIVSGDKDLLALVEYEGIRILSPRAYLDFLLSSSKRYFTDGK